MTFSHFFSPTDLNTISGIRPGPLIQPARMLIYAYFLKLMIRYFYQEFLFTPIYSNVTEELININVNSPNFTIEVGFYRVRNLIFIISIFSICLWWDSILKPLGMPLSFQIFDFLKTLGQLALQIFIVSKRYKFGKHLNAL